MAVAGNRLRIQEAATATGNGLEFDVRGYATTVFQVYGTFSGTITFEGSLDGTNWVAVRTENLNDGSIGTTATAAGLYRLGSAGLGTVRARISVYTSGSITVVARGVEMGAGFSLHT